MCISARARLYDGSNARHNRFSSLGPTAVLASLSLVLARSVMCQVIGMFSAGGGMIPALNGVFGTREMGRR